MLLSGGEDELGIRRWLFQGLQESVEGILAEHVHLVDDVDLVTPDLWGNADLLHQIADVLHRIVGSRVKLIDVERGVVVESPARLTFIAGFHMLRGVEAIDGFGHDARTGSLSYTARTTKQISLCQRLVLDGVLQRRRDGLLSDNRVEGGGSVFSR